MATKKSQKSAATKIAVEKFNKRKSSSPAERPPLTASQIMQMGFRHAGESNMATAFQRRLDS